MVVVVVRMHCVNISMAYDANEQRGEIKTLFRSTNKKSVFHQGQISHGQVDSQCHQEAFQKSEAKR